MNKENRSSLPDESKTEELLAKIQPVPSRQFHQNMQQAAWRMQKGNAPVTRRLRPQLALAILSIAALTALFFSPQGQAWAQEIFQFFSRINSNTVEIPESDLKWMTEDYFNNPSDLPLVPVFVPTLSSEMAALSGCETPQKSQSYRCQVALAEFRLGFNVKELPATPEEWQFDSLHFDTASKSMTLQYSLDFRYNSYGMLFLSQGLGDFPTLYQNNPWSVVPADKVETVKVGEYNGEYVMGSFTRPTDSNSLVWDDSDPHQRLAWSDGTQWYLIEIWPNLNVADRMSRDQLIELAESLVDSHVDMTEPLDPDYLYSISDAEAVSGFDLKAPTLLPLEMSFSYARYYAYNNEVRLFYGPNNELAIYQWRGKSMDMDTLPKDYDPNSSYEIVQVHDERAFYGSVEGPDAHHFLWWEENGIYYQMYFYQFLGKISRDQLIAIAESMQNIDDFRTKDSRPYDYVSIYEQALQMEALEFRELPGNWSYANVWADPTARCITVIYKSHTEPGYMWVDQCRTDKRYISWDVPSRASQQIQIGKNNGVYISGDFVIDNNGKLAWDADIPIKQLYWQENGLWIKLVVSGESAALLTQEDLISYAERLR